MPKDQLPSGATMADTLDTLNHPENYLRGVVSVLKKMSRDHGDVAVRIGITGKGIQPNYRVDHLDQSGQSKTAFDGQTHRPFTDVQSVDTENWSSNSLSYGEVRGLLGKIRGYKV